MTAGQKASDTLCSSSGSHFLILIHSLQLLDFSVLPSTPEGTRRVPRRGKFARRAFRRCYAGDVTVMKSLSFLLGACRPIHLFFCPYVRSLELR